MIINTPYGIIYSALNTTYNKRYIGQTIRGLNRRKSNHLNQSNVLAKEIGVGVATVNNVLLRIKRSTKGMILIFEDEFSEDRLKEDVKRLKEGRGEFAVFDKKDNFIGQWSNRTHCENEIGYSVKSIQRQLKRILQETSVENSKSTTFKMFLRIYNH